MIEIEILNNVFYGFWHCFGQCFFLIFSILLVYFIVFCFIQIIVSK